MTDTKENAQAMVDMLNDFLAADPVACSRLMASEVPCSPSLLDHPRLIPWDYPNGAHGIRFLGVVNALFSPEHRVSVSVDGDEILKFSVADVTRWSKQTNNDLAEKMSPEEVRDTLNEFRVGGLRWELSEHRSSVVGEGVNNSGNPESAVVAIGVARDTAKRLRAVASKETE
jgi:hypothetical protein